MVAALINSRAGRHGEVPGEDQRWEWQEKAGQGGMRAFPVGTPAVGKMRAFGKRKGMAGRRRCFPGSPAGAWARSRRGPRASGSTTSSPAPRPTTFARASTVVRRSRGTAVVASCASFAGPRREAISATRSEGGGYAGIHARPNRAVAGAKGAKAVGDILRGLGLGKYVGVFAREEIDAVALRSITDKDLEKLGIPLGPRKKILAARRG